MRQTQMRLFRECRIPQLLKWIGNKQRFAPEVLRHFPSDLDTYIEPFVGSGAVLGVLSPNRGLAGDALKPLIDLWNLVQSNPDSLINFYAKAWESYVSEPEEQYRRVRESFNRGPNPHDLLFLSRSCYGGVVRFTREGKMSTPIGPHRPIPPAALADRISVWHARIVGTRFVCADFEETMAQAKRNDVVYCDPPYSYSQSILYGAQKFEIDRLWKAIDRCKSAGARVALSLDGRKKSGSVKLAFDIPKGLFERGVFIDCGRSMLKRFQMRGRSLEAEVVEDQLLLTW